MATLVDDLDVTVDDAASTVSGETFTPSRVRTLIIEAELRTLIVEADPRTLTVPE